MFYSKAFIPTLKNIPSEAEVISHQFMLRAGFVRKLATGVYSWLPMGQRVLRKIERIVREEMNRVGACELMMPMVQPASLWCKSGRWENYGRELLRFKDRHNHDFCLAPTHEEVITNLVRYEVRSYRDMPLILYQMQVKFRDEIRPRFGVIRSREFLMKDAYSFDVDEEASEKNYKIIYEVYRIIFDRLGLRYFVVEADSGSIGGFLSHEFVVQAENGEDSIVNCVNCNYAAKLEKVKIVINNKFFPDPVIEYFEVVIPGINTVKELASFLKVTPQDIAKTVIYLADGNPVAAMVRSDREVNEVKLKNLTGAIEIVLASPAIVFEVTGAPLGFSGPLKLTIPVYVDQELFLANSLVVGANKKDTHFVGVYLMRDFPQAYQVDLRNVMQGDSCPKCYDKLLFTRGIEVGHIFRLGTKYSKLLNATYQDINGNVRSIIMGCYGIGISRIVAAAIEQGHDESGIIFPLAMAPVLVVVVPVVIKGAVWDTAKLLHDELWAVGVDTLLDDRNVRPGVKFQDSDLLGIPFRLVVSDRNLVFGKIELKMRAHSQLKILPLDNIVNYICKLVQKSGIQCFNDL